MEDKELFHRIEELASRCARRGVVTCSGFLTPAEIIALTPRLPSLTAEVLLTGGGEACERQLVLFLPEWMTEPPDIAEHIAAVHLQAFFGEPGHRDFLGAVLGLGVGREWVGDIRIAGSEAWVFCRRSVESTLCSLDKVGRYTVKAESVPLSAVPAQERRVRELRFTVKSLRLDAVTGELFSVSRTAAAEAIRLGLVSLNHTPCTRIDAPVREGDIISLRGKGKAQLTELGGLSRKDRLFITAERFL